MGLLKNSTKNLKNKINFTHLFEKMDEKETLPNKFDESSIAQ